VLYATHRYISHTSASATGALKTFYQHHFQDKRDAIIRSVWYLASVRLEVTRMRNPGAGSINPIYEQEFVHRAQSLASIMPKFVWTVLQQIGQFQLNGYLVCATKCQAENPDNTPAACLDKTDFTRWLRGRANVRLNEFTSSMMNLCSGIIPGIDAPDGGFIEGALMDVPGWVERPVYDMNDFVIFQQWVSAFRDEDKATVNILEERGNMSQLVRFSDLRQPLSTCHLLVPVQDECIQLAAAVPLGLDFPGIVLSDFHQYQGLRMAEEHRLDRESGLMAIM